MTQVSTTVQPGVCGFTCRISVTSEDSQNVRLSVQSECEKIQQLARALGEADVDAYRALQEGHDGVIHVAARANLKGCCSGCVVPAGLYKSMQVAAGLALPVACSIEMVKS